MERADRQILAWRAFVGAKLLAVEQAPIKLRDQPFAIGFVRGVEMIRRNRLELMLPLFGRADTVFNRLAREVGELIVVAMVALFGGAFGIGSQIILDELQCELAE